MTSTGETLPLQTMRTGRTAWRFALLAFLLTLAVALVLGVAALLAWDRMGEGRIAEGVSIAGISVGGLDRADAEARLRQALPDVAAGEVTLRMDASTVAIPYATLDRRHDLEAALDEALGVGRGGGLLERIAERVRIATRGDALPMAVVYDEAALDGEIDRAVATVIVPPSDASLQAAPDGTWSVLPATEGRQAEAAPARAAAHAALAQAGSSSVSVDIPVTSVAPAVTTDQAQGAADRAMAVAATDLTLTDGEASFPLTAAALRSWITLDVASADVALTIDRPAVQAALAPIVEAVDVRAVDAGFAFGAGRVITAVPAEDGRVLDMSSTVDRILAALEARAGGSDVANVELAMTLIAPEFTTAEAEAAAPRVVRVSSWTTRFLVNEYNFYGNNISVPTTKIDGTVVAPGRWFDFWKAIGDIRRADGYGPGAAIINGRTEPTGVIGGGLCSCSTTIFNAALRAGLEIGERHNHYYYITRYPVGLDATVYKSSSGATKNVRFRNDTEYPVLIRGINRYGMVRFELYTVPLDRTVELSTPRISDRQSARDTLVYTDALAPGVRDRTEYPTAGFRSWVTRTVRDSSGAVVHRETYYSNYTAIDGVTLVGRRTGDPPAGTVVVIGG